MLELCAVSHSSDVRAIIPSSTVVFVNAGPRRAVHPGITIVILACSPIIVLTLTAIVFRNRLHQRDGLGRDAEAPIHQMRVILHDGAM